MKSRIINLRFIINELRNDTMKRLHTLMLLVLCAISVCAQDTNIDSTSTALESMGIGSIINTSLWFLVPILLLSCVMAIQRRKQRNEGNLTGFQHTVNHVSFDLSCVLLWGYIFLLKENSLWFFNAHVVGLLSVIGFLFLGFVSWTQVKTFQNLLDDIRYNHNVKFSLFWGLWSTLGIIPVYFLLEWLFGDNASLLTMLAYLLCQLVQIVVIFVSVFKASGLLNAVICSFTYFIGYITVFVQLFVIIFICISWFILKLVWVAFCAMANRNRKEEEELLDWMGYEQSIGKRG